MLSPPDTSPRNPADKATCPAVGGNNLGPAASSLNPSKPEDAPPSYDDSLLPSGWEMRIDQWQRVYYIDHTTHTTHWELPSTAVPPPCCDTASSDAAPVTNPHLFSPAPVVLSQSSVTTPDPVPNQVAFEPLQSSMGLVAFPNQDTKYDASCDPDTLAEAKIAAYPRRQWTRNQADFFFGPIEALADTVRKNLCVCIFVLIIWAFLGLIASSLIITEFDIQRLVIVAIGAGFFYGMYLRFVGSAFWGLHGKKGYGRDFPHLSLDSATRTDYVAVKEHLLDLERSAPILTLHVECYHMRTLSSG